MTRSRSTRATATIDLNSVDTRDEQRDGHLRSADFFDVEKFGQMTFTATSFDGTTAVGDLTIKGVTKPVELDVEFLGAGQDPWGGQRLGFEATRRHQPQGLRRGLQHPAGRRQASSSATR